MYKCNTCRSKDNCDEQFKLECHQLEELQNLFYNYSVANNIRVEWHFACYGDDNKFYTNGTWVSLECVNYHLDDFEDVKQFFTAYLDRMREVCVRPFNRIGLHIADIVNMDDYYEVIVGGALFSDEVLN